ncbi:MAG: S9 family peptidase [Gemmatimonadales bacterium]|jgi:dipeptidyl aminopeptidase/acylaminoacyl peptidase
MRQRVSFLLALAAVSACSARGGSGAAAAPDDTLASAVRSGAPVYGVDQFVHVRNHAPVGFAPDGRTIAFASDVTGRRQIWTVPTQGGWPVEVTFGDEPVAGAAWARDGASLVFERDSSGNERYDLYSVPAHGGAPDNLTATPAVRENIVGFSEDQRFLAYVSDSGRPGHFELWVQDLTTGRTRRLTSDSVGIQGGVWSHDSRSLALARSNDFADVDAVLLDVGSGNTRVLTPHTGSKSYTPVAFSPDDRQLLLISDAKDGVPRLAIVELGRDSLRWVDTGQWPIEAAGWSAGGSLAYSENADGRVTTYLSRPDASHRRRIGPERGVTVFAEWSADGRYVLLTHADAARANDVWVHDVRRDTTWQVTFAMTGGVESEGLPPAVLVHYPTFDGRTISAYVHVPFNLRRDGSNPAIVMAHGGPSGQWTDGFSREAAYFADHGYVVIRPNVRGSTGYGKAFEDLNNLDWGGGDLRDLVAAADYLVASGYVARSKIAVLGGSYGGYLTLAALAFTPERWAAGVDLFGISSLVTLARTTDPRLMPYLTREMGDPATHEALLRERSPLLQAERIRAPLLILQGDDDPRVPLAESRQIADAVRRHRGVVEMEIYRGEGHGFHKLEDQLDAMRRAVEFLDRYVKGRG